MVAIQGEVHPLLAERREILADKMRLFGEGCLVLEGPGRCLGYAIAHPWRLGAVPPLDTLLGALPKAPDCLFIHDVAVLPEARGQGAGGTYVRRMFRLARDRSLPKLALVSVYGTSPVWQRCGFELADRTAARKDLLSYGGGARYMTAEVGRHAD